MDRQRARFDTRRAEPELENLKELSLARLAVNLGDVFEQLGLRIDGGAIELDTTKGLIWEG